MKRHMEALRVSTANDHDLICIEQLDAGQTSGVMISADQVPLLIRWLEDAVTELNTEDRKRLIANRR